MMDIDSTSAHLFTVRHYFGRQKPDAGIHDTLFDVTKSNSSWNVLAYPRSECLNKHEEIGQPLGQFWPSIGDADPGLSHHLVLSGSNPTDHGPLVLWKPLLCLLEVAREPETNIPLWARHHFGFTYNMVLMVSCIYAAHHKNHVI